MRSITDIRFVALLEAAPDAMVCVAADGRITMLNAQMERLFGYAREELEGQPLELLVPDAARAVHPHHRAEYAGDPRHRPMGAGMQLAGRRRDGSTFPAEISLSAIDTGQGILITAAVRDVTSRRQAHEDLERANRSLESFAYSVSHDLRGPLQALAGFSAALLEECGDSLSETGLGYAARIQSASEQVATRIDGLLHLARVSRSELTPHAVDVGAEVAGIARELQRADPGRPSQMTVQQPVWVLADRSLVCAAVRNLLDNAWKFTAGQRPAEIEFGTVSATGIRVCCYVRDNGVGFDPACADTLFRPFQRLPSAREFPGTGIGLATVAQIVERHGGRVWAEGAVGRGATFYFTLPAEGHP